MKLTTKLIEVPTSKPLSKRIYKSLLMAFVTFLSTTVMVVMNLSALEKEGIEMGFDWRILAVQIVFCIVTFIIAMIFESEGDYIRVPIEEED